jgi:hypothetical protein
MALGQKKIASGDEWVSTFLQPGGMLEIPCKGGIMKKLYFLALIVTLATAVPALAQGPGDYSGAALNELSYSFYYPGDAQYVPASGLTPALAQLLTADSGTSNTADSPAVFVEGPLGNLSAFSASYDLYSSSGGGGNPPYWILWVNTDGGTSPSDPNEIAIIGFGGSTIDGSSDIHVYDPSSTVGSYWGETLSQLDTQTDPAYGLTFGNMPVAWAGVEIGDWAIDDSISASANFDSLDIPEVDVPEGGSGSLYLLLAGAACFAALALSRRLGSASAPGN